MEDVKTFDDLNKAIFKEMTELANDTQNITVTEVFKIISKVRSYKFGKCDADFVLDVVHAAICERFGMYSEDHKN